MMDDYSSEEERSPLPWNGRESSPEPRPEAAPMWSMPEGLTQQDFADALRQRCDRPEYRGLHIEKNEVESLPNGKAVPLGELVDALTNGPRVDATSLGPVVREAFDYHGLTLSDVRSDLPHLPATLAYMPMGSPPRQSGWETEMITQLDRATATRPGVWPDREVDGLLSLQWDGLSRENWDRMPSLRSAFERNGIPVKTDPSTGRVMPDEAAYGAARRPTMPGPSAQVTAAVSVSPGFRAGQRRPRDGRDSPSSRPDSPGPPRQRPRLG
ncbi:hypothetical protein ABT336_11575 [Micromonospora sp. NPDC000207]|uniref:hypothetical protein n=1 Tax=Micromonospora sp. NPDC000207 TaxID=3154246 RepID=UPI00332CBA1D